MADTHVPGSEPIAHAPKGTTLAQLLTPTPHAPNDGYVHLGTLRVEKAIFDDFKTAQHYLSKSSEAVDQLYALEHGRTQIDVRSTGIGHDEFGVRDGRPTISWAPKGALVNTNGTAITPANGLEHETGHATRWLADPARFAKDATPYPIGTPENATWTTPEERRNITGLERRVGATLHEGSRDDHHGTAYTSHGPTSIESEAVARVAARISHLRHEGKNVPSVGDAVHGVVSFDHKAHTGSFVDMGGGLMAQSVGRGTYMMYDVAKDLGGHRPPEADPRTTNDPQHGFGLPALHHDHVTPTPHHGLQR